MPLVWHCGWQSRVWLAKPLDGVSVAIERQRQCRVNGRNSWAALTAAKEVAGLQVLTGLLDAAEELSMLFLLSRSGWHSLALHPVQGCL